MPNQTDTTPIVLSPATYERHAAAVEAVERAILTRDPRWGTGRFPGLVTGRWGILASGNSITAASGTSLGSGVVKFCDSAGVVLDDGLDVTVMNSGAAISATGGDKIVRLGWTAGDWCVTCGGSAGAYE